MTNKKPKRHLPQLSKSRFLSGEQCKLKLWYDCYERQLAPPVDAATQAIFDTGHEVGELATRKWPEGVLIDENHLHQEEAREHSARVMKDKGVSALFEAGLVFERVRVRVDILARAPRGAWDLVEVKSTLSAKDVHIRDLAVQLWVAKGAGLKVRRASVMTLNRDYIYQGGDHDLDSLFSLHDLTAEAEILADEIEVEIAAQHKMLAKKNAPALEPGEHCHKPYECPYFSHCTRDDVEPESPIWHLPRLGAKKRAELEEAGVSELEELPDDFELNEGQERAREAILSGRPAFEPEFKEKLKDINYPVHHLDFETFNPAIPRYKETHPYQVLPFQWSNHIEAKRGRLTHDEYLCTHDEDPRVAFVQSMLKSLGTKGSICIYSQYEVTTIRRLMEHFPKYFKPLAALIPRTWDLLPLIRQNYYHPEFRGSFSIKNVLPALVPSMSYEGMTVADGSAASIAYRRLIESEDDDERHEIEAALLEYCGQDTLAMVKLREALAGA